MRSTAISFLTLKQQKQSGHLSCGVISSFAGEKKADKTNKRKELLDPSTRIVFLVSNLGILEWGHNMDKHSQKSAKKTSNKCNKIMLIAGKKDTADVFLFFFKKNCFYGGKRQKKNEQENNATKFQWGELGMGQKDSKTMNFG